MSRDGGRFGGDIRVCGTPHKHSARSIRRLMKKYPDDKLFQEEMQTHLDKYEKKIVEEIPEGCK